jgi:hypothetical protein
MLVIYIICKYSWIAFNSVLLRNQMMFYYFLVLLLTMIRLCSLMRHIVMFYKIVINIHINWQFVLELLFLLMSFTLWHLLYIIGSFRTEVLLSFCNECWWSVCDISDVKCVYIINSIIIAKSLRKFCLWMLSVIMYWNGVWHNIIGSWWVSNFRFYEGILLADDWFLLHKPFVQFNILFLEFFDNFIKVRFFIYRYFIN